MHSQHQPKSILVPGRKHSYGLAIILWLTSQGLLWMPRTMAQTAPPGTVISNQATGSFLDSKTNTTNNIVSNIVSVTVGEIAGITIVPNNLPVAITGNTTNFDFTVTNVGNDPTKFFLPNAPSSITGGTAGTLQVVGYIPAGGSQITLATPINITTANNTGNLSDPTLGGNTTVGSIPVGAAIVVRVPVTVAATGSSVSVTLGNTTGQPSSSNTPYVAQTNDLYTFDNPDGAVSAEVAGLPLNGDTVGHRQEASATQSVTAIARNPIVLLVKRITGINGTTTSISGDNLSGYLQQDSNPYDDNVIEPALAPILQTYPFSDTDMWPNTIGKASSTFLIGGINGGQTRPGDVIEYSIYFLSSGNVAATGAQLCDRVPNKQTFVPKGYNSLSAATGGNGSDRGIEVSYNGSDKSYTNTPDGDTAQYFERGVVPLPAVCGGDLNSNPTGAIVVNLGQGATGTAGGSLPNAMNTPNTDAKTYGFVRFKAKVD